MKNRSKPDEKTGGRQSLQLWSKQNVRLKPTRVQFPMSPAVGVGVGVGVGAGVGVGVGVGVGIDGTERTRIVWATTATSRRTLYFLFFAYHCFGSASTGFVGRLLCQPVFCSSCCCLGAFIPNFYRHRTTTYRNNHDDDDDDNKNHGLDFFMESLGREKSFEFVDAAAAGSDKKGTHRSAIGGDFAGIKVHLDHGGRIIPLPESWIPESLREWDQVVDFVETLVSEEEGEEDRIDSVATLVPAATTTTPTTTTIQQHVLIILPETGCAVDNLDVIKNVRKMERVASFPQSGVECFQHRVTESTASGSVHWRVETVFDCNSDETAHHQQQPLHRIRLGLLLARKSDLANKKDPGSSGVWTIVSSSQFTAPCVEISWERQFSTSSSFGTLADGGGLDGQRVSRWMGPTIQKQASSFATTIVKTHDGSYNQGFDNRWLNLPGNLTLISCGSRGNGTNSTSNEFMFQAEYFGSKGRRCVRWNFSIHDEAPSDAWITMGSNN